MSVCMLASLRRMRCNRGLWEAAAVLVLALTLLTEAGGVIMCSSTKSKALNLNTKENGHHHRRSDDCLSWRRGVETNNVIEFRTVPVHCVPHVAAYMLYGQYDGEVSLIVDNILNYSLTVTPSKDGKDAWILDVDDTCISNLPYYMTEKKFGNLPYDPKAFKEWALKGVCHAIPQVRNLFHKLIEGGFKVFLVTGRDEITFGNATILNLKRQGYFNYERLILRDRSYQGQSAVTFKSTIRQQLVSEGYRIWGNVGDEWSDLQGPYAGNRTFKLPNPMYFVP